MDDLEQKVKKIIAEQLGKDVEDIKNEASFIEDLGADSLDTVADTLHKKVRGKEWAKHS